MSANDIWMFIGPNDDADFRDYARSIGLSLLHPHAYKMTAEENEAALNEMPQMGLFSYLPADQLHRHPHADIGLCEALDPLIRYIRHGYEKPYLVASNVHWYTDYRNLAELTKPYFQKLRRWIKANWKRREDGSYMGPDGERILREEHAQFAYLRPNVEVRTIYVDE